MFERELFFIAALTGARSAACRFARALHAAMTEDAERRASIVMERLQETSGTDPHYMVNGRTLQLPLQYRLAVNRLERKRNEL